MRLLELDWMYGGPLQRYELAIEGAFYLISFCGGLREEEVPLTNIGGTKNWWIASEDEGVTPHVKVALLGQFKSQVGEKYRLKPMVAVTRSSLKPRLWIGRDLQELEAKGIMTGPMFHDSKGEQI